MKTRYKKPIEALGAMLSALLLLLTACQSELDPITIAQNETYSRVEFRVEGASGYEILVNGDTIPERFAYVVADSKPDVEVLLEGKTIFSDQGMTIPEDRTFRFNFMEVLGYGLKHLPKEQMYHLIVTIDQPFEGMKILVKGINGKPEGIEIESGTLYTANKADIVEGDVVEEIYKGSELLKTLPIDKEEKDTNMTLVGEPDALLPLTPPSQEMRDQLKEPYDTWISFMYSAKDYPDIETMVVELAPSNYFADPSFPDELKEGNNPVKIMLSPDTPTPFTLFNFFEEGDSFFIYKLYDAEKEDQPLLTIDYWPTIFICDGDYYNEQGEDNYKFRTYKFVPMDSPEIPEGAFVFFEPYPAYVKAYSFK